MMAAARRATAIALRAMRPTDTLNRSWRIFPDAGGLWLERNAFVHAGSLAFYTLFRSPRS
jgi:hypothetical protein